MRKESSIEDEILFISWIGHVLADVVPHFSHDLSVLDALVLKVKDQLVSLAVLSLSTEQFLIRLWVSCLELLVVAYDSVVDFDFLECIHVKHAELKDAILAQSLSRPRSNSHVEVVLGSFFVGHGVFLHVERLTLSHLRDTGSLNLDRLTSDVRLCLLMLSSLELLELLELFLVGLEELF